MSAKRTTTFSQERPISISTFIFNEHDRILRNNTRKSSAFISRLKAIENNRLEKEKRLNSAKKTSTKGVDCEVIIGNSSTRPSINRLSIASILPEKSKSTAFTLYQTRDKNTQGKSYKLHTRILKKQPLYDFLVDEMKEYFSRASEKQRIIKQRKIIQSRKEKKDGYLHFLEFVEQQPHNFGIQLEVAGRKAENSCPLRLSCNSNYFSPTINVEDCITQAKSFNLQEETPRNLTSSTVPSRKNSANARPSMTVSDVTQLYGKEDLVQGDQLLRLRMLIYRDFLWKVAFSNMFELQYYEKPRFYIGRGNNSRLIRNLMAKRWWWVKQTRPQLANLLWTQLKLGQIYANQPSAAINRQRIQNVDYQLTERDRQDPSKSLMNEEMFKIWRRYLSKNAAKEKKTSQKFEPRQSLLSDMPPIKSQFQQKTTNHLEFSRFIGNKKALLFTMRQYYRLNQTEEGQYLPLTYHITQGLEDDEYLSFLNTYRERKKQGLHNYWIIKPGQMSNRGNGINVCQSLDDIKAIIKSRERHENGKQVTYILQQYLHSPMLYRGRKFDIRHYLLISCINGIIKGYWYEEGYIRTTSYEFNLNQLNSQIHLTNDAVQKYCKDYGKYEKGNKLSYREFQLYLDEKYGQKTYDFMGLINKQIRKISTDIVRAAFMSIDPRRRANNFEVFGMDFMVDSNFKPWLIEVNTNPCLQLSSPLLSKLIPSMIDNALRLTIDVVYPPPMNANKKMSFEQNRFHLVFDELTDGSELELLYRDQKPIYQQLNVGEDDEAYEDDGQDEQAL